MSFTRFTAWAAAAAAVVMFAAGCEDPQPKHESFLKTNPWVVKKPWEKGNETASTPVTSPTQGVETPAMKQAEYKPDTEIYKPILECKGKWTIRLIFYHATPDKGLSALYYANDFAHKLAAKGYDPYVTDFISLAIVSVGSFDDPHDPKLVDLWRECYTDWTKLHGGRPSAFSDEMEQFYGEKTALGDQPWPIAVIDLQAKMKHAYGIELTPDEKRRYQEFLSGRKATSSENP